MIEGNYMGNRYAIYSRKSKYTGKGESIENQIELCKEYIRKIYGQFEPSDILIYEDEGYSGKNTARPQYQIMMREAVKKNFSMIICYRLDRISRNIGDFAKLVEELNTLGISFVSIKEQFDTSSPMGRAMMYIASVFSQLERETIAERIRDNMIELAKTGRWLGGTTPTGYASEGIEKITLDGKKRKLFQLKLLPEEAELVRLIYQKYLELQSLSKVETFLILNGYNTKNNKNFTRFTLKGILSNPVYMIADQDAYRYFEDRHVEIYSSDVENNGIHGFIVYNRTMQSTEKRVIIRPMQEWIVCEGKHIGLIPGMQWRKVQKILENNKSQTMIHAKSHMALFSGLLFCGNCGNYMRPKTSHTTDGEGNKDFYYLCSGKEKSRGQCCNMKNPNGKLLDRLICHELDYMTCNWLQITKQIRDAANKITVKNSSADIERRKKQIQDKDKEINQLISSLGKVANTKTEDYILKRIAEVHDHAELIKKQVKELEMATVNQQQNIEFNTFLYSIKQQHFHMYDMDLEQRRAAIRKVIDKVVWDGTDVHIYFLNHSPDVQDCK